MRRLWTGLAALAVALIFGVAGPSPKAAAGDGSRDDPFVVTMVTWRGWTEVEDGFLAAFRDAGLEVEVRHRDVDRDRGRFAEVIAEIKADPPDLVYSWGTGPALALSGRYDDADPATHITDVPHVFTMVTTPIGAKLTESLAGSGRHVTGTSHVADVETQLRAIQAYLPVKRLGVLYNPGESNMLWTMDRLREAAPGLGITLVERAAPLDEAGKAIGGEALTAMLQDRAIAAPLLNACSGGPNEAAEYRHSIFHVIAWHFGPLGAMAKGEQPFDQAVFERKAGILENLAQLPWEGFPEGSADGSDDSHLWG